MNMKTSLKIQSIAVRAVGAVTLSSATRAHSMEFSLLEKVPFNTGMRIDVFGAT